MDAGAARAALGRDRGGCGRPARSAQRPFTLAEIFREPESRRRVLLATAMSFATTVGWWAVSSWLPAYTEGLAKAAGEPADLWGPRMGIIYNVGAIAAYVISGFVADAIGRRAFLLVTYAGCIAHLARPAISGPARSGPFMGLAFLNGFFTLGFAFSWMAIYLVELFTPAVRATAASFVFNGARLIAWIFPIIAGQIVTAFGGVAAAALTMSSVYVIGLVVPVVHAGDDGQAPAGVGPVPARLRGIVPGPACRTWRGHAVRILPARRPASARAGRGRSPRPQGSGIRPSAGRRRGRGCVRRTALAASALRDLLFVVLVLVPALELAKTESASSRSSRPPCASASSCSGSRGPWRPRSAAARRRIRPPPRPDGRPPRAGPRNRG